MPTDDTREPLVDYPPPPDHQGADGDFSDAPYSDPGAPDAVRFAGCAVQSEQDELKSLGARQS